MSTSARTTLIRDKIVELLGTIEPGNPIARPGEEEYVPTWTLSTPGQVLPGRYEQPIGTPFACVYWLQGTEEWGEGLGNRKQKGVFVITAWARPTPSDPAVRQMDAELLAADIRTKLRSAPTLENTVRQFLANAVTFDGIDPQRPDEAIWGATLVEIHAEWIERL